MFPETLFENSQLYTLEVQVSNETANVNTTISKFVHYPPVHFKKFPKFSTRILNPVLVEIDPDAFTETICTYTTNLVVKVKTTVSIDDDQNNEKIVRIPESIKICSSSNSNSNLLIDKLVIPKFLNKKAKAYVVWQGYGWLEPAANITTDSFKSTIHVSQTSNIKDLSSWKWLEISNTEALSSGSKIFDMSNKLALNKLPRSLCGRVYVIGKVDSDNSVMEIDESDNKREEITNIKCEGDIISLYAVEVDLEKSKLIENHRVQFNIKLSIVCMKSENCAIEGLNLDVFTRKSSSESSSQSLISNKELITKFNLNYGEEKEFKITEYFEILKGGCGSSNENVLTIRVSIPGVLDAVTENNERNFMVQCQEELDHEILLSDFHILTTDEENSKITYSLLLATSDAIMPLSVNNTNPIIMDIHLSEYPDITKGSALMDNIACSDLPLGLKEDSSYKIAGKASFSSINHLCGHIYAIVRFDASRRVSTSIDGVKTVLAPVFKKCKHKIAFRNLTPDDINVWQNVPKKMSFTGLIVNLSNETLYDLKLVSYLSADYDWDPRDDVRVDSITYDDEKFNKKINPGEVISLNKMKISFTISSSSCLVLRYIIVIILPFKVLTQIPLTIHCYPNPIDLVFGSSFNINAGAGKAPGASLSISYDIKMQTGKTIAFKNIIINHWLSKDKSYDDYIDYPLTSSLPYNKPFDKVENLPYSSSPIIKTFSSSLTIPSGINKTFCGNSYLITILKTGSELTESN